MKGKLITGLLLLWAGLAAFSQSPGGSRSAGPVDFAIWSENMLFADPEAALVNILEGYRRAYTDNDAQGIAYCNGSLASYWMQQGESGRVGKLLDSCRAYADSAGDIRLKIKNFRRQALWLSNQGLQAEAGREIQKGLNLLGTKKFSEEVKLCNAVAAIINCRIKKKDKFSYAREYIRKAAGVSIPGLDGWAELIYGAIEDSTGNTPAAISHYRKAAELMEKEVNPVNHYGVTQAYFLLARASRTIGDTDSALHWYRKILATQYAKESDTVKWQSHLAVEDISRRKADSLLEAKGNELNAFKSLSDNEKARKLADEEIRKRWTLILMAGLALLALSIVILVWKNRQRRKINNALENQKAELQTALSDLRNTQMQLLHREKMASLGELTAGIAHEIQNPLNFVNNFSEINIELLEELEEKMKEGISGATGELISNIRQNSDKITFHGKRADSIVKGMLQHSRSKGDQKELSDINSLVDESIRLGFHGMRAKEKDFNAVIETDFSGDLPEISVIAQDIERVLLNLFTNAFYAMMQKKRNSGTQEYQPRLHVSTARAGAFVQIVVRDNGPGVPEGIRDKIFQPFFTTKPPGEGTGLGLSLSYDIITKIHGGDLKLQSREGEHTEFVINLPIK